MVVAASTGQPIYLQAVLMITKLSTLLIGWPSIKMGLPWLLIGAHVPLVTSVLQEGHP